MTPPYGYTKVDIDEIMKRRGFEDKGIVVMILIFAAIVMFEAALWFYV